MHKKHFLNKVEDIQFPDCFVFILRKKSYVWLFSEEVVNDPHILSPPTIHPRSVKVNTSSPRVSCASLTDDNGQSCPYFDAKSQSFKIYLSPDFTLSRQPNLRVISRNHFCQVGPSTIIWSIKFD